MERFCRGHSPLSAAEGLPPLSESSRGQLVFTWLQHRLLRFTQHTLKKICCVLFCGIIFPISNSTPSLFLDQILMLCFLTFNLILH